MAKHLLVTGGSGFIGSNFIRFVHAQRPDWQITNLDALTYSGNMENLSDLEDSSRYDFVKGDIRDRELVQSLLQGKDACDAVVHFAAESHVDRSILNSQPFIDTNVSGTLALLDVIKAVGSIRIVNVSTDEVYGSLSLDDTDALFTEQSIIAPNSPYAAAKASADMLVRAYVHTFGIDAVTTRCSNNFGPYQFPEKVIPLFVTNLDEGKKVPLYGDGKNVRDWIYVDDHCEAVLIALERGVSGEVYNIGGNNERNNLELTHSILEVMGMGEDRIEYVTDRLGHDRRYAIDATKIKTELGWQPTRSAWPQALENTVRWYVDNPQWCSRVKSGEYRTYYEQQYGGR
jgi:dTDP-glucose 4,6-dehydratase